MDTTVLVLSPLGMQVVSVELGPDDEVGLKLPFLPRLKVLLFILNTCALWVTWVTWSVCDEQFPELVSRYLPAKAFEVHVLHQKTDLMIVALCDLDISSSEINIYSVISFA